jgi:hypothetical protein
MEKNNSKNYENLISRNEKLSNKFEIKDKKNDEQFQNIEENLSELIKLVNQLIKKNDQF